MCKFENLEENEYKCAENFKLCENYAGYISGSEFSNHMKEGSKIIKCGTCTFEGKRQNFIHCCNLINFINSLISDLRSSNNTQCEKNFEMSFIDYKRISHDYEKILEDMFSQKNQNI